MKSCAYCGIENDDETEACPECGTTKFEVGEGFSAQPRESATDSNGAYERYTELPLSDAKKFLERLQAAGVEVRLEPMEVDARIRVGFGRTVRVQIFTRSQDDNQVERIWREFCGIRD
jgi:hypothetical protein